MRRSCSELAKASPDPIRLIVDVLPDRVRVEVSDRGGRPPSRGKALKGCCREPIRASMASETDWSSPVPSREARETASDPMLEDEHSYEDNWYQVLRRSDDVEAEEESKGTPAA